MGNLLQRSRALRLRRETLILSMVCLLTVMLFSFTAVIANQYRIRLRHVSADWAAKGQRQLALGKAEEASGYFRNALAYDPRNPDYQLYLAQALGRVGQPNDLNEAETYLLRLWQQEPGNGTVNLELARLYARKQDAADAAIRYFQNAIYGFWPTNADQQRRDARLELVEFLLKSDRKTQADAELISLLPSLPREPQAYVRAGNLFLRAGDYSRALEQFRRALRMEAGNPEAVLGAGNAAFQMGDLRVAKAYLERAAAHQPANGGVKAMLDTLNQVQQIDPFEYRLSRQQRAARVRTAVTAVSQRLAACQTSKAADMAQIQAELAQAAKLNVQLKSPRYLLNPDAVDSTMSFVFDAEALATRLCGQPQGIDLALQWIARTRESS